ncbi:MAG: RluA family pseudouridine synthase [Lachnospiraceae bacterium]|nr:RluA family pseudouridine synthase [Lachnospiraceae bacterium]
MKKCTVGPLDEGQRLDKFLTRYLKEAEKGFLYRMLRKKNITLNGKKAEGSERLKSGDEICFFFSDETFEKFRGKEEPADKAAAAVPGDPSRVSVVYEDDQLIFMNKPAGMLSQKARPEDISLCEHLAAYLKAQGGASSAGFSPGVANRLDRNTSGLVLAGKTLPGQQLLAQLFQERGLEKYYLCIVKGRLEEPLHSRRYWKKDAETNTVQILTEPQPDTQPVELMIAPEKKLKDGFSLLRVRLITGKSHQIRAQLAALGLPVLGDGKYGEADLNRAFAEKYNHPLRHQLLHAYEIVIPADALTQELPAGSARKAWETIRGRRFTAPLPANFSRCLDLLTE